MRGWIGPKVLKPARTRLLRESPALQGDRAGPFGLALGKRPAYVLADGRIREDEVNEQSPLPFWVAMRGVAHSVRRTAVLLMQDRIHLPTRNVGTLVHFTDGTTAGVYRESTVDRTPASKPAVLVVTFRLRLIRGRGHPLFRMESILNTPLFIGFPGFVSKLWLTHDGNGAYRGIYQWDDPVRAENYARALWQVLAIGCVPGSIRYHVVPGRARDDLLYNPGTFAREQGGDWWLPDASANTGGQQGDRSQLDVGAASSA